MAIRRPSGTPSGLGIGIAINAAIGALLVLVILAAAGRENAIAAAKARDQVHFTLIAMTEQFTRITTDYGWWDEAYDKTVRDRDIAWGDANLGEWLGRTADISFAMVVDEAGDLLYSWPHEGPRADDFTALIQGARLLSQSEPMAVSGFALDQGRPALATATLLRPMATTPGDHYSHTLVIGWDMEKVVVPALRRTTRLDSLYLAGPGSGELPLRGEAGVPVAALAWTADQPGHDFLRWVLPVALLCLSALSGVAWIFWRRAWRNWRDLVAADDTRVRLLAAISHDLRQPLQSMSLFATVLEAEVQSERGRAASGKLRLSVQHMGDLLEAILKLAKLDMRLGHCEVGDVALGEVLAPLVEEMRPQAEVKGLSLRYVPTSCVVKSDPVLLASMVRNLVSNAVRYTSGGHILVGCRRRRGSAEVWVCDTGMGIAEDKQGLIFEEFYQVGNSARDFREGVGLGLAIVQRLARMLNHRVTCRSRQGGGSRFTVSLPLN